MQTQGVTINQIELPRYRVVRGFEGISCGHSESSRSDEIRYGSARKTSCIG
jgi:hypothetical protein